MEETSLTDFAAEASADTADRSDASSTVEFVPGGGECAECGESAKRLWTDDGDAVCWSCKRW